MDFNHMSISLRDKPKQTWENLNQKNYPKQALMKTLIDKMKHFALRNCKNRF